MMPVVRPIMYSLILLLATPQILLGASFLVPTIENHGTYKSLVHDDSVKLRSLNGHVLSIINKARKLSTPEDNKKLKLSIFLSLNNEHELDQKLLEITNPKNHLYRQFMSQERFMMEYAPSIEQVTEIKNYLAGHGIITTAVDKNRLVLHAFGSVKAINKVFNTEIANFADEHGKQFYAPVYELQVPMELNIHSVHGLENYFRARPQVKKLKTTKDSAQPKDIQGLSPSALKSAYSLSSGLDGSGQTVALFELEGFNASDISAYRTQFNLPAVPVTSILVDGATSLPGVNVAQVTTDIELMMAMAPGLSQILVYQGPNTAAGIIDTYNQIAADNLATSISTSWTSHELSAPGSLIGAEAVVFKQMAAQGQAIFAASGNNGAYNDGDNLGVEDPASQPLVVGVGGTSLTTNADGSYNNETTWFNSASNQGSGGGISSLWHATPWQQSVINDNQASYDFRNVPDVSLNADPAHGYAIYVEGQWAVYGGTGAVSSLWAGFIALVNQSLVSNGYSVMGFPAEFIYQAALDPNYSLYLHDISDNSSNGYNTAVEGYDLTTGLGSLSGDALLEYFTTVIPPVNTCVQAPPLIIVLPPNQIAQAGDSVPYIVYIVNQDNATCGVDNFYLSATLPDGFSASFDPPSFSLQPNDSIFVLATITSSSMSAEQEYPFSINVTSDDDPIYNASAIGTYQVLSDRGLGVNLSITPENGTIFYQNSYSFASFQIILTDNQAGIANYPTTISVTGPDYYFENTVYTQNDGSYMYYLLIDQGLALGDYTVTVRTNYQDRDFSAQTNFNVLPFP